MKITKIFCALLAVLMLAGCGGNGGGEATGGDMETTAGDMPATCEHEYLLTEEKAPGVFKDGYNVFTCSKCGDSYTEEGDPATKTIKILAIGNSFSVDAMEQIFQIAASCGAKNLVLGNLYIGGCTLATHYANSQSGEAAYTYYKNTTGSWTETPNVTMEYGITDENWDIITLQQASGSSGQSTTYRNLPDLADYVNSLKTNSDCQLYWHMTWAYQQDSDHPEFIKYANNQTRMYEDIVDCVKNEVLPTEKFAGVIPCGTVFQNIRTSSIGDKITRDGFHAHFIIGRYALALTWLNTLTDIPIDDAISTMTEDNFNIIKEAVINAAAEPYAVTQSSYVG